MDLLKILAPLADFEANLGNLYAIFSEKFAAEDREASELFEKMAIEERSHRDMVNCEKRTVEADREAFGETDADLTIVLQGLARIETMRKAAVSGKVTVDEAVQFALYIEDSACESYLFDALRKSNERFHGLMKNLADQSRDHELRIRKFAEARGLISRTSMPARQ